MPRTHKSAKPQVEAWVQAGKRLYDARKSKGLSALELAVASGYKQPRQIYLLEKGKQNPATLQRKHLIGISKALDVSIAYICDGCMPEIKKPESQRITSRVLSIERTELARARIAAKMKSKELAAYLGMNESTLRRIETGWCKVPRRFQNAVEAFIAEHQPVPGKGLPIDATDGEKLAFKRKQAQITQARLAVELGVHHTTISDWENGVNRIPKEMSCKINAFFEGNQAKKDNDRLETSTRQEVTYGFVSAEEVYALKEYRKSLGVTQKSIASFLGVSQSWIAACENGHAKMNRERQLEIKRYLDKIEEQKKQN